MRTNKISKLVATGFIALGMSASAVAATAVPFGWYVEGNVGSSRANNVTYTPSTTTISRTGLGWNLNLGYKFIPYFAAEVGYTSYADTIAKVGGTKVADDAHSSYDIAGKGILPINDSGFEMFAKLGLARAHSHVTAPATVPGVNVATGTNNSSGLYFGLGGDYTLLPNVTANLQWARVKGNSSIGNLDLISAGVAYTFS